MVIISNISSELYRTTYYSDKGKEEPFGRIAVGSMVNAIEYFGNYTNFATSDTAGIDFRLFSSQGLRTSVAVSTITFTTNATYVYEDPDPDPAEYYFEIIAKPSTVTDESSTKTGAIVSFK